MGRSRRSPAQKAALARALQISLERRRNKLDLPSGSAPPLSPSSHPPVPNSIHQSNVSLPPPTEDRREPKVDRNSVSVRPATQRAQKQNGLKRVAALERDLQDALRRESELREENRALKERCRGLEQGPHEDALLHELASANNTMAAPESAVE